MLAIFAYIQIGLSNTNKASKKNGLTQPIRITNCFEDIWCNAYDRKYLGYYHGSKHPETFNMFLERFF